MIQVVAHVGTHRTHHHGCHVALIGRIVQMLQQLDHLLQKQNIVLSFLDQTGTCSCRSASVNRHIALVGDWLG
jgi:hypothetical protein